MLMLTSTCCHVADGLVPPYDFAGPLVEPEHAQTTELLLCLQMGKLADFVGGQGKKGGKRWRLVFTAGAGSRLRRHCLGRAFLRPMHVCVRQGLPDG